MTLNEILVSALAQLDRGHDSQTLDTWRDKLTRFANEAVIDLAYALRPVRTDAVCVEEGVLDVADLPRSCVRITAVNFEGKNLPFFQGVGSDLVRVPGADGTAQVTYQYMPKDMSLPTDVPEIADYCHGLIVTYVVGRERASGEASTQRGANVYFELYNAGKRHLRAHRGEEDTYRFYNRWNG